MSKHSARLLVAIAASMMADLSMPTPLRQPRVYTDADQQRREKAEAKRQRKAAKRAASKGGAA